MTPPEERRQFVRLDTTLAVKYRVLPSSIPEQATHTKNIGGGGLCVFLKERLPVGTPLEVQITLPGREKPAVFTAEVIWCEESEMVGSPRRERAIHAGVRFVFIHPTDQDAIMQHVILNLKAPGGDVNAMGR